MRTLIISVILIGILIFIFSAKVVDSHEYVTCYSCNGSGEVESRETCPNCKGKGQVFCTETYTFHYSWFGGGGSETVTCNHGKHYNPRGDYGHLTCWACNGSSYHDCYKCSGYGELITQEECPRCGGDGEERIKIKITLADKWNWN